MISPVERIVNSITLMATQWGLAMDGQRMKIYRDALIDLPPGAVEKGVWHLIKTRPFAGNLPVVAEIRDAADLVLKEELLLLAGPPKRLVVVNPKNAYLYADKNCQVCKGRGAFEGELPSKICGTIQVTVRCDCVQEPE